MAALTASIVKAVRELKEPLQDLQPYKFDAKQKDQNQFVFFLKPEVTTKDVKLAELVEMTLGKLAEAKVSITAVRVLSGPYLKKEGIMAEHYGVISKLSREGQSAMTDAAKAKLQELFGEDIKAGAEVLGAHQLLAKFPELSPLGLRIINDNLGVKRLAGGTYISRLDILGKIHLVVNPFHPFQLVPYTSEGQAIVVMVGSSPTPWADLRSKVCGATNPGKADAGSIRDNFLKNKEAYGFSYTPSSSANGCHMSAGPLEALVEIKRFFKVTDTETAFGTLLTEKGVKDVSAMGGNPDLTFGDKVDNCFDATEEMDAGEAATKLAAAKPLA